MSATGTIKFRVQTADVNNPAYDISADAQKDSFVVGGGVDRQVMVRDTTKSNGFGLVNAPVVQRLEEWVPQLTPVDNNWRGVCYSPELDRYVSVASNGTNNRVMTSADAVTWVIGVTPSPDKNWIAVIWVGAPLMLYVAVGENGIMTSPDGFTWTNQVIPSASGWHDIVWADTLNGGNGLLVAVAWSGHPNQVMTSPNGVNWTLQTTPFNAQWEGIGWSHQLGMLVAGADSGTATSRIMRSTNGTAWTLDVIPNIALGAWYDFIYSPEWTLFVALNHDATGPMLLRSADGVTWLAGAGGFANSWRCMCYAPELGIVVVLSSTGRMMISTDGIRLFGTRYLETLDWQEVIWVSSKRKFVAVAMTGVGARVMTCTVD